MMAAEVKYKKTGIDWMPEVPEHWEVRRMKNICFLQRGHDLPKEKFLEGGYPVYGSNGIIGYHREFSTPAPCLTIGRSGSTGEIQFVEEDFWAHNTCLFVKESYGNNWRYLYYLLSSIDIKRVSNGTAVPTLDRNNVHVLKVGCPPHSEQKAIAKYLDAQSAKITRFIQTKQRFIELLKEQRQSIITNAVTKGIDDGVEMKETVLGEIPEHWEVRRLGTIGRFSKGGNISRSELISTEEGVPAILYGDLYTKYDIVAENIINRITKETAANSVELKKGDLLFTGSGETKEDIGKCVIFNSNEPAYAGGDVIIFKQDIFDSYFISYSQNSSIAKYQKAISSKGEIIVHTYGSKLRDVIMPYPPTIEEQKEIVEHIKTETRTLDIAINKAEREIELIKEYREAMIAEAVTGKMELQTNFEKI